VCPVVSPFVVEPLLPTLASWGLGTAAAKREAGCKKWIKTRRKKSRAEFFGDRPRLLHVGGRLLIALLLSVVVVVVAAFLLVAADAWRVAFALRCTALTRRRVASQHFAAFHCTSDTKGEMSVSAIWEEKEQFAAADLLLRECILPTHRPPTS
jgi:hypothetical protein